MRPRLTSYGTGLFTIPISWGETIAGLMKRKNIIIGTGWICQNNTALEVAIDTFASIIINEMQAFLHPLTRRSRH